MCGSLEYKCDNELNHAHTESKCNSKGSLIKKQSIFFRRTEVSQESVEIEAETTGPEDNQVFGF